MVAENEREIYKILLIKNQSTDVQLIKELLVELGQIIQISDINNFNDAITKDHWNLIIVDMYSSEIENRQILKTAMEFIQSKFLLIFSSQLVKEYILGKHMSKNVSIIYKPLEKHKFMNAIFQLSGSPLDRRNKVDRNKLDRRKDKSNNVLFIGAHPDDVEIGCGGSIARHYAQGDSVYILTLSCGQSGGDIIVRRQEAKEAAAVLHANLIIKELPDTEISDVNAIRLIDEVLEQIHPTHVYTHTIHDTHQDHRNVHYATEVACRGIANVYCYQSPSSTIFFQPSLFIEITDYIEKKLSALAVYQSQIYKRPYLQEGMIRATARYWGRYSSYDLVEPMEIIRQTDK